MSSLEAFSSHARSFAYTTAAAITAISIVYPLFVKKTFMQLERAMPVSTLREGLKERAKAGVILGAQINLQNLVETKSGEWFFSHEKEASLKRLVFAAVITSIISAPLMAAFNARTGGKTWKEAFISLSPRQVGMLTLRELGFLFTVRVSEPLSKRAKKHFGDHKAVEYTTAGLIAMTGSMLTQPADTLFTRMQFKLPLQWERRALMLGWLPRMMGVTGFVVSKKAATELFPKPGV